MSFISFNTIPLDIRTPGQYLEFDSSKAQRGLITSLHKVLIFGQKLAAGAAAANVPVRIFTYDQAVVAFGRGSMLARMFLIQKALDPVSEVWALPLTDLAGGTAATGTITYTGPATAAGTYYPFIAGQVIAVGVTSAMTATQLATAVAAAVNALTDLPVTAASAAGVVTLTARHKGLGGNAIDIRENYSVGQTLPAGLTSAIVAMSGGAGNPDATAVFTAIGDTPFSAFIHPYTDAANLLAIETALAGRWGAMKMIDGLAYTAAFGSLGTLTTLGDSRNSQFSSILGVRSAPNPPWEWAAAYGAQVGFYGSQDPGRPFDTLILGGLLAPSATESWTHDEREALLRDGISTYVVAAGGVAQIDRAITTYQTNALGFADQAYLNVNVPMLLSYYRYSLRVRIATKFPRHMLGDDGRDYDPGLAIVTPGILRAEIVAWYDDLCRAGLAEGLEQFKRDLIVERDATDRNRVNARLPTDVINQFHVFAGQIQFLL